MNKAAKIIGALKYIGLLGLPIFFSDLLIWKLLWLFWLFALVEIFFYPRVVLQSFAQMFYLPYTYVVHGFKLPSHHNFRTKIAYSLPFEGSWTVINGGVEKQHSHSWGIPPQRYAYDFLIVDSEGSTCSGDNTRLESYHCYGKTVLSPADGTVVAVKDGLRDSKTFGNGTTDVDVMDIRGNHIVIAHAHNEYSTLAHLLPQSIVVKVGQTVRRGEPVARCGNSGNSSEPHLHFQVQDSKHFFSCAGLPISFQNVSVTFPAQYDRIDPRPRADAVQTDGERTFLSRGQSVSNN